MLLEDFTKLQDALLRQLRGINADFAFISWVPLGNLFPYLQSLFTTLTNGV